jgi:hypothetical protein
VISSAGRTLFGPIRILATASARVARAHGNPDRSPSLAFGHPPKGSYVIAASLPPGRPPRRARRYGRLGAFVLEPVAGEEAAARRRVVLHGGPLDPSGRLRPTRGGLRVSDRDLAELIKAVNAANVAGDPIRLVDLVEVVDPVGPARREDHPARRLPREGRARVALARRQFLEASALLLVGVGVAAAGCIDDQPSRYPPSASDPPDAGSDPSVRDGGGDDNGGFTTGGGVG